MLIFPDTKLMATTTPLREEIFNSTLEDLVKTISKAPFKFPEVVSEKDNSGYEMGDKAIEKYHEAGYDAFITGLCFIGKNSDIYYFFFNFSFFSIKNIGKN